MATNNMAAVQDDGRLAYPRYGSYSQIMRTKIENLQSEAHQLQTEGKLDEAVKRINRGLALVSRNPDLYRQKAEALAAMGDIALALQNMQKAISLSHPNSPLLQDRLAELHRVHGEQLEKLNEHSTALTAYNKAFKLAPRCKLYTYKRIACLMQLGRYDECLSLTEAELKETPSTISLLVIRAKLKMMFGNMTQAYYSVQNALELDPENESAIEMREELSRQAATAKRQAMDYCLSGKEKEAIIKLTAAIQADPSDPAHHLFRGALHRQAGRYSTAVDEYLTAINKCNHNRESTVYKDALRQLILTYNDFAVDCFRRKHYSDAVTLLNKALKEERNEPVLFTNRGDCFFKLRELEFALADYQRSCELTGAVDMALCYRLAVVNHSIGIKCYKNVEYKTAESHFTQSITHSSLTAHFYQCRARARYELKNDRGAREDTLRALLLNPTDEYSIPLIARLFPGRTVNELVHSDIANKLRPSLLPAKHQPTSATESNEKVSLLNKLLEGLTIQQEKEEAEESDDGACHSPSVLESPQSTSSPQSSSPQSITSPRLWPILHSSNPPVLNATGIMPHLKTCLDESEFHKQILDAKRTCTEDVERLFQYTRPPSRRPLKIKLNT